MNSYNSLYLEISNGNISGIDKPLIPVNVGMFFKNKVRGLHYRNCLVTKVLSNSFEYEYVNENLVNPQVDRMIISFVYWRNNSYTKFSTTYLK